jgi:RecA/RadA recombinase
MKRVKLKLIPTSAINRSKSKLELAKEKLSKVNLIPEEKQLTKFINSGSWGLNLALTNDIRYGYPIGRVINPVGDYSVGKTLMACEAINSIYYIEHLMKKKKIKMYYDEPEYAFDFDLGFKFNMPLELIYGLRERLPTHKPDKKDFKTSKTVEDLYNNLDFITKHESNDYDIIIYIVDSLDALRDAREITHLEEKGIEKQDYGGGKARVLSQLFRNCIEGVYNSNIILFIVSQIRTNFGVTFGNKYTRAGGKALDHYASQIFWMREVGKITHPKTKMNQGMEVEVQITKNKLGDRYNRLNFNIINGHGVDNIGSAIDFLKEYKIIEQNGAYLKYQGENILRDNLIDLALTDDSVAEDIRNQWQNTWLNLVEMSKPNRPAKWSEGRKIV